MPSFAFRNDISGDFLLFDMLFWANLTLLSVILLVAPESPAAFFDLFQPFVASPVANFPERKPGLHHGSTDISVMSEFCPVCKVEAIETNLRDSCCQCDMLRAGT